MRGRSAMVTPPGDSMQRVLVVRAMTQARVLSRRVETTAGQALLLQLCALQYLFNTPWRFKRDGQDNRSSSGGSPRRRRERVVGAVGRRERRRHERGRLGGH